MTLEEFVKNFDYKGAVVLLEGKRNVLDEDRPKLIELGKLLASKTKYILFRSGNATGADEFFSKGVVSVNSDRLQVITPYDGHRKKSNYASNTVSLDQVDLLNEPEVVYQSKFNKKTEKLIDQYVDGKRDRFSIKAAYIIRDTIKVLGTKDVSPINFGIFYDDLKNPLQGGTGHTMDVCKKNNINLADQSVWIGWLK